MDDVLTTPTPETTTSSAPSTSSPASEPSTSSSAPVVTTDRPSIKDALTVFNEQARMQGRKPRGPAALAASPGTPTTEAASTASPTSTKGPIPFDVHDTALQNARTKTRTEVEHEYQARVAAADEALNWQRYARENPGAFVERMLLDGLANPAAAQAVKSVLGKLLHAQRTKPTTDQPPSVFITRDGQQYYDPALQDQRDQWLIERIKRDLLGEVQPSLQKVDALEQERAIERHAVELDRWKDSTLGKMRALPYFTEHEAEIKRVFATMPQTSGHPAEEAAALRDAYDRVVLPKLSQLEQNKVLASLKQKANASSLNPAATGAPTGIPKAVRAKDGGSMKAALEWARQQAG